MTEEVVEDILPIKQINNQPNTIKDIFLGIFLFVGMNLALMLTGHILSNLFWKATYRFFDDPSYYVGLLDMVKFATIFFINIVVFIYLIIKRPRMVLGILAGIPILIGILFLLLMASCLFIFIAWTALLFLNWLGLI